jgi:hypothetical protein
LLAAVIAAEVSVAAVSHFEVQEVSVLEHPSTQLINVWQPAVESQVDACDAHLGAAHEKHADRLMPPVPPVPLVVPDAWPEPPPQWKIPTADTTAMRHARAPRPAHPTMPR